MRTEGAIMNSSSLEKWQIERIYRHVRRELLYFEKLTGRMHQKHFPQSDPMKAAGEQARAALTDLATHLEQLLAPRSEIRGPLEE
jgi:hypothetical protein